MKLTVTNTVTKEKTNHASMKLANMHIEEEIELLNEEGISGHYYTRSDFKIS